MSGVYIEGIRMPVIETEWRILLGVDRKWYAIDANAETADGEWHEIVPVPDHGRLIDADALIDEMASLIPWAIESPEEVAMVDGLSDGYEAVKDAPTIIEAEEGE